MVNGGDGGKGLGAFKQFRPSLDVVSAEPLTRAAPILPQRAESHDPVVDRWSYCFFPYKWPKNTMGPCFKGL